MTEQNIDPIVVSPIVPNENITFDDFKKIKMAIGKIISAEKVPETDKLLRLNVDFNEKNEAGESKPRQVVSGISTHFPDPELLVGNKYVFVINLEPRVIKGFESQAMILAASTDDSVFSLISPSNDIPQGVVLK